MLPFLSAAFDIKSKYFCRFLAVLFPVSLLRLLLHISYLIWWLSYLICFAVWLPFRFRPSAQIRANLPAARLFRCYLLRY